MASNISLNADTGLETAQWIIECPLSPLIKRQKMEGYCSGGTWCEGRVELKFNTNFVDRQARQTAKAVILQGFTRLDQTIIGEGLFHRPYAKLVDCVDPQCLQSPSPWEYLGDDGDASIGRIGSVIPISYGYAMYGRIDNIQVLVQDPAMFTQLIDELIDTKVSNLRQATVSLGALEMERKGHTQNLKFQNTKKTKEIEEKHQDKLVTQLCEKPTELVDMLAAWELERQHTHETCQAEYRQKSMNIEHDYHQKKREIHRTCLV